MYKANYTHAVARDFISQRGAGTGTDEVGRVRGEVEKVAEPEKKMSSLQKA